LFLPLGVELIGNVGRKQPRHLVTNQTTRSKSRLALRKPKDTRKANCRAAGSRDCHVPQKSATLLTMAMLSCEFR
jgi:hypothetical protein